MIDIALAAGREIMNVYDEGAVVAVEKADGSPVTQADQRAESVILKALRQHDASIPVVAEEEAAAGRVPETMASFYLVDPLDGTREFLKRNGEFTVNIALVRRGVPVMGVVYAPALGEIYVGDETVAQRGSVRDDAVGPLQDISVRPAAARVVAIGSRSHGSDATDAWLQRLDVDRFVSKGSSLKFCLLAAGEVDVYPRLGRTMEWDTAAGDAILRAAGGTVRTLDGAPLGYDKRKQPAAADFTNPHFVAYGDPSLLRRVRSAAVE